MLVNTSNIFSVISFFLILLAGRALWTFRKFKFETKRGTVLYMGTDTIPPPRADIIVRFVGNKDNFRSEIDTKNRQIYCFCDPTELPLKSKSIDYLIVSNLVEFCNYPTKLLKEVERVAKAGYLESPHVIAEYLYPHPFRVNEIVYHEQKFLIRRKHTAFKDEMLAKANLVKTDQLFSKLFNWCPQFFTVRIIGSTLSILIISRRSQRNQLFDQVFIQKHPLQEIKQKRFLSQNS